MNITGLQVWSSCFYKSTPPSPNEDASNETLLSLLGYRCQDGLNFFEFLFVVVFPRPTGLPSAQDCGLVWSRLLNVLQTCLGGLPSLRTHGLYEHSWVQVSLLQLQFLSGSTSIPFALTTLPRNLIVGTRKVHLSMLIVTPALVKRSNTFCNL